MMDILYLISTYDFIWRAFVCGALLTICAAILGVSLVLKRLSMIGDGLSHISFGAIAIGAALGFSPLKVAIPLSIIAAIILFKSGDRKMKGDSGIAVVSSGALAVGIIMISYTGSGADINNYLIGSLYSVTKADLVLSVILCAVVLVSYVFLFGRIFASTFDEDFLKATGGRADFISTYLAVLTSVTVVIAMRLMGALLISALIVFPALSAMRVFKSFLSVTICSLAVSLVSFALGFLLTLILDAVPTGACITVTNLLIFMAFSLYGYIREKARTS